MATVASAASGVAECKLQDTVGQPVVQDLHSAAVTYDYDRPTRGIVVTTGQLTDPARHYAVRVSESGETPVDLIGGATLRDIGEEVDLDLYNGRIEAPCDETLRPYDPVSGVHTPNRAAFGGVGSAGGHREMTGGEVPLGVFADDTSDDDQLLAIVAQMTTARLVAGPTLAAEDE